MNTSTSRSRIILSITRLISYGYDDFKIVDNNQMHLWCNPFLRPSWCAGTIPRASPNERGPWLPRKPLDAATGWVFRSYCPSSRQGNSKQNNNQKMYHTPLPFWQPRWCAGTIPHTLPDRGGSGLWLKSLVTTIGQVLRPIIAIGHRYAPFVKDFSLSTCYKRDWGDVKAPNNNRGMTYHTDGKEFSNTMWYLVGDAKLVD